MMQFVSKLTFFFFFFFFCTELYLFYLYYTCEQFTSGWYETWKVYKYLLVNLFATFVYLPQRLFKCFGLPFFFFLWAYLMKVIPETYSHCRNKSKIKYQNRWKRKNRYPEHTNTRLFTFLAWNTVLYILTMHTV